MRIRQDVVDLVEPVRVDGAEVKLHAGAFFLQRGGEVPDAVTVCHVPREWTYPDVFRHITRRIMKATPTVYANTSCAPP